MSGPKKRLLNELDLVDFFRSYAPERLEEVAGLLNTPPHSHPQLMSSLEAQYSCPRFFDLAAYNFSGRRFNPLACLYDGHVVPPVPTALPMDNLSKASVLLPPSVQLELGEGGAAGLVATGKTHGVEADTRDARQGTLLDWLCTELPMEGPLGTLKALRGAGVQVLLEGGGEVRGKLQGLDAAFNLLVVSTSGENILVVGSKVLGVALDAKGTR
jgi:hypothetical protein